MTNKSRTIRELRQKVKDLEAEIERLNLCKPIYQEPLKTREVMPCSMCGGTGRLWYPYDNTTGGKICPGCNGSGVVTFELIYTLTTGGG